MTVSQVPVLATASDYLGLSPEQRYEVASRQFPDWLRAEPIQFPPHHLTYGWACRVSECDGVLGEKSTHRLCHLHRQQYRIQSCELVEFVRKAEPQRLNRAGWALSRNPDCQICGNNREARRDGYCRQHYHKLAWASQHGDLSETNWQALQHPLAPLGECSVPQCVHDGDDRVVESDDEHRVCRRHLDQRRRWLKTAHEESNGSPWGLWLASPAVTDSVTPAGRRGELSLANLSPVLQREVRYSLHRHMNTARRTHWRPTELQTVVDAIAVSGAQSLSDPVIVELGSEFRGKVSRRIWLDLPFAARSLAVTDETAKAAGWFDPLIVGSAPFAGTQGDEHRRKRWDLTAVSQRWLRDLLWDYLRDEALAPTGKRLGSRTVYHRIIGFILLSHNLRHNRSDHGDNPALLGAADAKQVKDTWDLWHRERIPLPDTTASPSRRSTLNARNRFVYMSSIRIILQLSRRKHRTPTELDSFILSLPEYPRPPDSPRPRPLSFGDFQLLVNDDNIGSLAALDHDDVGLADIWLTQAFQGGRISETIKLRLGCIGLIGAAQPYLWRDISKAGIVDYGMPCYLPVYERLLRRQAATRAKLRIRYAEQLATLDDRRRAQLEAGWDREMPLFPSARRNPDLVAEVSQSGFRLPWSGWFESLGLKGITTHQTRATLATSLLNNGAPAALVRQLLGHISEQALAHYANYSNDTMTRHLQQIWTAGPGMDKPGTILLRPAELKIGNPVAAAARIDLTVVPVEHGLCRYGPVVGGTQCPWEKNCTGGLRGPCEHFVLTGADLAYWERKRDASVHFAEGAPTDEARDYILSQWEPWEHVLANLREALDELGLLEAAEKLDLRSPFHDYFDPLFSTGFHPARLNPSDNNE